MIGMFSLRASATARCSLLVSTTQIAEGTFCMSRIPPRLRSSLFFSRVSIRISFLVRPSKPPVCSMVSSSLRRCRRLCTVEKLVSMPPSQRWFTYGMPTRVASSAMDSCACFLVPTNMIAAAVGDSFFDELVRLVDVGQRLLQIDDVDAVAVGEDEPLHLGIPATGLMPEVGAAVQQLLHCYDSHSRPCPCLLSVVRAASGDAEPWCLLVAGPVPIVRGETAGIRIRPCETGSWRRHAKSARASELRIAVYTLFGGAFSTLTCRSTDRCLGLVSHRRATVSWAYAMDRAGGSRDRPGGARLGRRRAAGLAAAAAPACCANVRRPDA